MTQRHLDNATTRRLDEWFCRLNFTSLEVLGIDNVNLGMLEDRASSALAFGLSHLRTLVLRQPAQLHRHVILLELQD